MDYLLILAFLCLLSPSSSSIVTLKKGSKIAGKKRYGYYEVFDENDIEAPWHNEAFFSYRWYHTNEDRQFYTLESDFNIKRVYLPSLEDNYYFNEPATIESDQACLLHKAYSYDQVELGCWNKNLKKEQNKCSEMNRRDGNSWRDMCESYKGCKYNHYAIPASNRCYDGCPDTTGEDWCLNHEGCGFDRETWTCFAANTKRYRMTSETVLSQDSCVNVRFWWHKGDPWYNCEWYESFPNYYCTMYGHHYQNFGLVANEACCVCKEMLQNRRALGSRLTRNQEETSIPEPKVGFLHKGGVLSGVSRKYYKRTDLEYFKPIVKKGLRALEDTCEEFNWWDADTHTFENDEILCPGGKAVGTLYQSHIMYGTALEEYSLQKGYCCDIPATISDEVCEWRPVNQDALGNYACSEDEVLTGFKMSHFTIDVDHISDIRCCAYLEIVEEE